VNLLVRGRRESERGEDRSDAVVLPIPGHSPKPFFSGTVVLSSDEFRSRVALARAPPESG